MFYSCDLFRGNIALITKYSCVHTWEGIHTYFGTVVIFCYCSPPVSVCLIFSGMCTLGPSSARYHAMPCHSTQDFDHVDGKNVNTSCRLLQPTKHSYSDEGFIPRTFLVVLDHACLPEESGCRRWVGIMLPLMPSYRRYIPSEERLVASRGFA